MDAHRAKLEQLSALIRNVTENPSLPDDREFEERLQEVVLTTRQLYETAQTATSGERSPLEILGDLEVSGCAARCGSPLRSGSGRARCSGTRCGTGVVRAGICSFELAVFGICYDVVRWLRFALIALLWLSMMLKIYKCMIWMNAAALPDGRDLPVVSDYCSHSLGLACLRLSEMIGTCLRYLIRDHIPC